MTLVCDALVLFFAGFFTCLAATELGATPLQSFVLGGVVGMYANYFFGFIK